MSTATRNNNGPSRKFRGGRRFKAGLLGACIGLGGAMLGLSPVGTKLELDVGKAWLFNFRGELPSPENVMVIGINGQTSEQLDLPASPRDWPRSVHARLIDRLVELGAEVIVFDIFFAKPKDPADDRDLARAIDRAGRVVLVEKLTGRRQPITDADGRILGMVWVEEQLAPKEEFARAARGLAPFPLPKIDAAVHDFWTFKSTAGNTPTMPAIAMQIYQQALYPDWLQLIRQLPVTGTDTLPDTLTRLGNDNQVGELMGNIRSLYEQAPGLGEDMDRLIRSTHADAESATQREALLALNNLYRGRPQRFINFYGRPGAISTVAYQDVLRKDDGGRAIPDLRGKIVFIGFSDLYDPGHPDRFYSVFTSEDGIDLSGVEIAATACANLMTDRSLMPADVLIRAGVLIGFGAVLAVLLYLFPAVIGVPVALGLAGLYIAGAQWAFSSQQVWLPLATPMLVQFPLALFLGLMGQYFLERRRGQRMAEALHYYVPDNVARDLTENRYNPQDANKVVYSTCLATDMAGFSTLAEKLPPGELALVLNDYFDTLAQPLKRHHVDVTEFRADAIMCAWTAATPVVEVRTRAVLAALDAVNAIGDFKRRHSGVNTNIRIGLEAGTVYVGHAGGGGRFVFSIVGDCANTASRVESLNKHLGTNLLATGAVVEGVENLLLRPLSRFQFVGKTEALPIVEIVATDSGASEQQRQSCEQFAEALALFHLGHWQQAQQAFSHFAAQHPGDGPTAWYLGWCERYLNGSAQTDDPTIIRMESK